jgi:F-type H+-transporting ATPase subunit b
MPIVHETTSETTQAEDEGVLSSLGLNGQLFVFQLINFAIVAVIVWYLILKPLTSKLDERKKNIENSLINAQKVETSLQMAELKYQEKIDEAKAEANRIIEVAFNEGKNLTEDMKINATKEVAVLVNHAKKDIQTERDVMVESIKKETASLVVLAVEKILNEKMDEKKDKKLIEESLKQ